MPRPVVVVLVPSADERIGLWLSDLVADLRIRELHIGRLGHQRIRHRVDALWKNKSVVFKVKSRSQLACHGTRYFV